MLRKIESLRKQPKEVRNRHAFVIASIITAVIALVWVLHLPSQFADEEKVAREAAKDQPKSSFVQGFVDLYGQAKNSISNTFSSSELESEETTQAPIAEEIDFRTLLESSSAAYESTSITSSSTTTSSTTLSQ